MLQKFFRKLFGTSKQKHDSNEVLQEVNIETSKTTGKDFEFLLTPSDIEIPANDFDNLMTPDSMTWTKITKNDWTYYQVDKDEFSYSWEMPGIQMTFNPEITYMKAKLIADEVASKLTKYLGEKVEVHFIPKDKIIRFD
jgi:hypothetical protein